ncbi:hypothetical protein JCM10207_002919 [Rhodosporidiobolus poonsookiae]
MPRSEPPSTSSNLAPDITHPDSEPSRRPSADSERPSFPSLSAPSPRLSSNRPPSRAASALLHHAHTHAHSRRAANLSLLDELSDEMLDALAGELRELGVRASERTRADEDGIQLGESAASMDLRKRVLRGRGDASQPAVRRASFPAVSAPAPPLSMSSHPVAARRASHSHALPRPQPRPHQSMPSPLSHRPVSPSPLAARSSSPTGRSTPTSTSSERSAALRAESRMPPPPYAVEDPLAGAARAGRRRTDARPARV